MSRLIRKKRNVNILLYHIVCPTKYRKVVFTSAVEEKLKEICEDISLRYEIEFLEIGTDENHVHFLVQSVPMYSPKKIVQTIKSITGKEMFNQMPELKKKLWGGAFWSAGYYVSTVGAHGNEELIKKYVKNQGREDWTIQPSLF